jgi:hypothetical protein
MEGRDQPSENEMNGANNGLLTYFKTAASLWF